jgi:hypothetical protein
VHALHWRRRDPQAGHTVQGTPRPQACGHARDRCSGGLGSYDCRWWTIGRCFTFLTLKLLTLVKKNPIITKDEGGDKSG